MPADESGARIRRNVMQLLLLVPLIVFLIAPPSELLYNVGVQDPANEYTTVFVVSAMSVGYVVLAAMKIRDGVNLWRNA